MLVAAFSQYFFGSSIFIVSLFLILLVLVQRGRGGGLTGALGGPGGQSAFGTKAGDLFTKITIGVAVVWILLCAAAVYFLKARSMPTFGGGSSNTTSIGTSIDGDEEGASDSPESGLGGITDPLSGLGDTPPISGDAMSADGASAEVTDDAGIESGDAEDSPANESEAGESSEESESEGTESK